VWTCERVAELIRREFGVRYHPAHVSRLVRALGLSLQKPARRADQRDEEAIEHWKEDRWPELKKGWFALTLRWERRPSSMSISAAITSRR
jgi:hypothetical protein